MGTAIEHLRDALAHRVARRLEEPGTIRAAVIVPLFERNEQTHLIFIRRNEDLSRHAGQISFPGGRYEDADGSLQRTALRETAEEIGLDAEAIEVLGALDDVNTVASSFTVSPFVAVVQPPSSYRLDAVEVGEVLEVPLGSLLEQREAPGMGPRGPYYHWRHHIIWGATARMLRQLLALLP